MARVELEGLSHRYGDLEAVSDIDLAVEDGEFVVVYGPPGAGKSTLLKLIAGIEIASVGTIRIGDRSMADLPPQRRDVTMAFESYALYPHFSVRGNLEFPLKAPGRNISAEERSDAIVSVARLLEIEELLDRPPYQLSGGQRQRVSLGRALVREASATLLDEPIAHLDARLRNALRAELRLFQHERGATTIYATPDYSEAFGVADRIAVLMDGRIEQVDVPQRIFDAPANLRVAAHIGDPKINLVPVVDCAIAGPAGESYRVAIPGQDASAVHTVGIRPDDIELAPAGEGIAGDVYVSEPLGPDEVVRVQVGEHLITVRRPLATHARMGERVSLRPRWERAIAFGSDGDLLAARAD